MQMLTADDKAIDFYQKVGFERAGKTEPMWIYKGNEHQTKGMIPKIWHGNTKSEHFEEQTDFMKSEAIQLDRSNIMVQSFATFVMPDKVRLMTFLLSTQSF